jgi:hypothetical protein
MKDEGGRMKGGKFEISNVRSQLAALHPSSFILHPSSFNSSDE